jgi:hypothetical protein
LRGGKHAQVEPSNRNQQLNELLRPVESAFLRRLAGGWTTYDEHFIGGVASQVKENELMRRNNREVRFNIVRWAVLVDPSHRSGDFVCQIGKMNPE